MEKDLIEKVRLNEIIYNYTLPAYRNSAAKREAWNQIGKELEITGALAKARWDNLRRCYSNARNRRRDSECKQAWKYEKEMCFLLPFMHERVSKNYASAFVDLPSSKSDDFTMDNYDVDTIDEVPNFKCEREEISLDGQHGANALRNKIEDSENLNFSNDSNMEAESSFRRKTANETFGQVQNTATDSKNNEDRINLNMLSDKSILGTFDHTDLFFLSMSKMTKQLPKSDQSKIKFELSKLVFTAEMKNNESQN